MNERIQELAEQAMVPAPYEFGGTYMAFSKEKFAELIVRECLDIAGEYDGCGSTIVSRIEKHFGVEQ